MKKAAVITGAGGYIGSETALTLAKAGIRIAVCDINEGSVQKTVDKIIKAGGDAKGYVADVSESRSIDAAINDAAEYFGRLDIMVHAAGGSARIAGPDAKYTQLVSQEDYIIDRVIKVNLYGAIYASRAAARIMIKQGEGGKIINFSSAVAFNGLYGSCDYSAAKGGVTAFTKSLAKELGKYKINVNSVAPGVVMRSDESGGDDRALNTNFLGERCTALDIAGMVEFLVSDKARFITGQTYVVDGGRSLAMKGSD